MSLLFKHPWALARSLSVDPRVLVVALKHFDNFEVAFVVGHFHNRPHERRAQWRTLGELAYLFVRLLVVLLVHHNSILSSLDSTLVNVWSHNELAPGLFDAWVVEFPEREAPGYTRQAVLPSVDGMPLVTVSRRIDRVSVADNLLRYGTSMFTTPVCFSHYSAVVMQFVGVGRDGHQSAGWRFPTDALHHPPAVEWMSEHLSIINVTGATGLEAFARAHPVFRKAATGYYRDKPPSSPEYFGHFGPVVRLTMCLWLPFMSCAVRASGLSLCGTPM